MPDLRPTLRAGDLAYFDTFAGLLPCRVLTITGRSGAASSSQTVELKLTANRGAYKRGEVLSTFGLHAVPRDAVRFKRYGARITYYTIEANT